MFNISRADYSGNINTNVTGNSSYLYILCKLSSVMVLNDKLLTI